MTVNKKWHETHKMPKNASIEERVKWHVGHAKNCSCRGIPKKLLDVIKKMKAAKQ